MAMVHMFFLLLWKNLKLLQRHWMNTLFEFLLPIGLFGLLVWLNSHGPTDTAVIEHPITIFEEYNVDNISSTFPRSQVILYYTPETDFTTKLMESVHLNLQFSKERLKPVSSESELELLHNLLYENATIEGVDMIGVVFDTREEMPKKLKYKIRSAHSEWRTLSLFPNYQRPGPMQSSELYFRSGFLALQYMIDASYIDMIKKLKNITQKQTYSYVVQEFPYPEYVEISDSSQMISLVSNFVSMGFMLSLCMNLINQIVADKRTGVTELMKLMGLTRWMLWFGWLLKILVVNVIVISVIVLLVKTAFNSDIGSFIMYSDSCLIWLLLLLYCIASAVFMFFISTLFNRPVLASCVGAVIWYMSFLVPRGLLSSYKTSNLMLKLLSSLFPNMAMDFGFSIILAFESAQIGAIWSNFFKTPTGSTHDMRMAHVFVMLIVDILLYGLLTAYVDALFPGQYGVPQPWNFFCTKSYWQTHRVGVTQTAYGTNEEIQNNFEPPLHGLKPGIRIKKLHKIYNSGKVAVDGVTLDIYQDQITALLGHNGAGKTTMMSVITGMLPPTSGSVFINEYDIRYDLAKVRESLGLCPQHNMLFDELSVMEHLMFFGMLKGLSRKEAINEGNILLKQIMLTEKANSMTSKLSGGMKRKLSLGIALIGGSKVVILDEPTSGLDPEARRQIWDLLLSMRGHRTIVITTHFMEEADVLGDRIAIMDHGQVQCYGTSLYLKNQYGAGYLLKLMVKESCDVEQITELVQNCIPHSKLKSKLGTELTYTLPSEEKSHYAELFDAIENKKQEMGILSIGVSITTMEEVFLKVGKIVEVNTGTGDGVDAPQSLMRSGSLLSLEGTPHNNPALFQQLEALLIKKMLFMYRKWLMLSTLALVPVLITVFALRLGVGMLTADTMPEPAFTLSLSEYGVTDTLNYVPKDGPVEIAQWYEGLVRSAGSNPVRVTEPVISDAAFPMTDSVLSDALIKEGKIDISYFREKLIAAAMFNFTQGIAMFSSIAYHSAPISVNLMNNAILRSLVHSSDYSITTINHPLMYQPVKKHVPAEGASIIIQQLMPLGLMHFLGYFLIFPLLERVSNAKHLQLMTGLNPLTYWLPCFVCDFFVYVLVALLMALMIPLNDSRHHFGGSKEIGIFLLLLIMYGLCGVPLAYVFSYLAKTTANVFTIFIAVSLVIGSILPWIVVLLEAASSYGSSKYYGALNKFLYLLPQYCFSCAIKDFFTRVINNNQCSALLIEEKNRLCSGAPPYDECCAESTEAEGYLEFTGDGIGWPLVFMFVDMMLYIAILLLVDFGLVAYGWEAFKKKTRKNKPKFVEDEVDADVKMEYLRVKNDHDDVLVVNDLAKIYGWKALAVKGVSFGVMPGECFGLLGVNGAGKTTTFKMLTGAEIPTEGDARIDQIMLSKHKSKYLSQIGYCPQFDAFNETLTGKEMLQVFARLRGVPRDEVNAEVKRWITLLGLQEYQHAYCGTYSGGNKRKLSTAMALIGDPPLVFLDEPTSGVDPVARRNLWSVLTMVQKTKHSIVLTSHSMEECEALCNRLAIMVKGQFVCLGENQYLKQKFGQGFTMMIKLKDIEGEGDQLRRVEEAVQQMFPSCHLKDKHQGLLHYHLTDPHIPWKVLFSNAEKLQSEHPVIEDYTISETTLEQLFLAFAHAGEETVGDSRV